MSEAITVILSLAVAVGYMRGRLNGLVGVVDRLDGQVAELEKQYGEIKGRLDARDNS